jgi:hypothetical protein
VIDALNQIDSRASSNTYYGHQLVWAGFIGCQLCSVGISLLVVQEPQFLGDVMEPCMRNTSHLHASCTQTLTNVRISEYFIRAWHGVLFNF